VPGSALAELVARIDQYLGVTYEMQTDLLVGPTAID
jgi:hypothetical protein